MAVTATTEKRSVSAPMSTAAHVVAPPFRRTRPGGDGRLRPPTRRRRVLAPRVVSAPDCGPRLAPLPIAVLVGVAAVIALVLLGAGAFAGAVSGADVPTTTTVVRVEPGESLSELAARMAPDSDVSAVVDKIRELNALESASVTAGQPLTVPFSR